MGPTTTSLKSESLSAPASSSPGMLWYAFTGLLYYFLTSLIPVLSVVFGYEYITPPADGPPTATDPVAAFASWDGKWYKLILEEGYRYDPTAGSVVAFFPAYPLLGRVVAESTGWSSDVALLVVAHLSLAVTFVILAAYARLRYGGSDERLISYVLLAFGLFPVTFYFRMAYTEALFLLVSVLALYAMQARWPSFAIAAIVGLATAVRPVGVALLGPLLIHVWEIKPVWVARLLQGIWLVPLTCWGLGAYMLYQQLIFDEPLAFAKTQQYWQMRAPEPFFNKLAALAALEPVWSVYDESSPAYWKISDVGQHPLFSMQFLNPIYFMVIVGLVVLGAAKGWLTTKELALAAGLLLIPYVTRSHEMCMASMGRFAAIVFPCYLVLGQCLYRVGVGLAAALLSVSGFFLAIYSALFASGYRFF
jgi:hypothetical protein